MTLPDRIVDLLGIEPELTHAQLLERLGMSADQSQQLGRTLRRLQTEGRVVSSGTRRHLVYRAVPVVLLDLTPRAHHWLAGQARDSGRTLAEEVAAVIERLAWAP